jgi:histidine triad (HIT) family protein
MGCLFCNIVSGKIEANVVLDEQHALAFRDIHPVASTHVLVVPKKHIVSLADATEEDVEILGRVLLAARRVAEIDGVHESGFRTVFNNGPNANQTVHHLHLHVIGGRVMKWPPG